MACPTLTARKRALKSPIVIENEPPSSAMAFDDEGHEVPVRRRRRGDDAQPSSRRGLIVLLGLVTAGFAVVFFVLGGMKDQAIYSKPVDELVANRARFAGRQVMAEGDLVHGTLLKREQPCEYRFTIAKNKTEVPVRFPQCVVPDTFRDVPGVDVGVTVEGELLADNTFLATKVLAKCPSKYEMKDKAARGEQAPHQELGESSL
jgi:cytochrome c-type biogenesis protein CcmE